LFFPCQNFPEVSLYRASKAGSSTVRLASSGHRNLSQFTARSSTLVDSLPFHIGNLSKNSVNDSDLFVLRAIYDFSKRTSTYLGVGHVGNKGTAAVALSAGGTVAVGGAQNGIITGIKHSF
jgi:predicted porin